MVKSTPQKPGAEPYHPPTLNNIPALLAGETYSYSSPLPTWTPSPSPSSSATSSLNPPVAYCMGIDEAGRGPVIGPMVYAAFYLPVALNPHILRNDTVHFDDSKKTTMQQRIVQMKLLTRPSSFTSDTSNLPVHPEDPADRADPESLLGLGTTGFTTTLLSAASISSAMLRPPTTQPYNLNAQATDATISMIQSVLDAGIHLRELYVDTIGPPAKYQQLLSRRFPQLKKVVVESKADSTYACVAAASVVAKVTRDCAVERLWVEGAWREEKQRRLRSRLNSRKRKAAVLDDEEEGQEKVEGGDMEAEADADTPEQQWKQTLWHNLQSDPDTTMGWGHGYPDSRCQAWLKANMHPIFGWGNECRFSWSNVRDMLEAKAAAGGGVKVEWPLPDDGETTRMTDYFVGGNQRGGGEVDELGGWFGTAADVEAF